MQTFFGRILTSITDQQEKVQDLFGRVHASYDMMNDVMSLRTHRLWKRSFINRLPMRSNMRVLDLAAGTGDIALGIWKHFKPLRPAITLCDPTYAMLNQAWGRAVNCGWLDAAFVCARAEALPFPDASYDGVTCAFGVRNMANRAEAFQNIATILKPGGWFHMLEFHPPTSRLESEYINNIVPWFGEKLANDRAAYQYLADSIHMFPQPDALVSELEAAGFSSVNYRTLGPVAIHMCVKRP